MLTKPVLPPVVLLGGGGHASVLAEICFQTGRQVLAAICPEVTSEVLMKTDIAHLSDDAALQQFSPQEVELVNGIGALPGYSLRARVGNRSEALGYRFATLISPMAIVSSNVQILQGAQVMPGSIVNAGAHLGAHTIVNTGAVVEHDCTIAEHVHISTRATLCGGVRVGRQSIVGPGAVIGLGVSIGESVIIGAGASVVRDLADGDCFIPPKGAKRI